MGGSASRPSCGMLAISVNFRKLTILETFGWPSLAWGLSGVFRVSLACYGRRSEMCFCRFKTDAWKVIDAEIDSGTLILPESSARRRKQPRAVVLAE